MFIVQADENAVTVRFFYVVPTQEVIDSLAAAGLWRDEYVREVHGTYPIPGPVADQKDAILLENVQKYALAKLLADIGATAYNDYLDRKATLNAEDATDEEDATDDEGDADGQS